MSKTAGKWRELLLIDFKQYFFPGAVEAARAKSPSGFIDSHPLRVYKRIAHHYSLIFLVLILPFFALYNLSVAQYWLSGVELFVAILAALSIHQLVQGRDVLLTPEVYVFGSMVILIYASYALKGHNILWSYCLVIFLYFMLAESMAILLTIVLLLAVVPAAFMHFSIGLASSFLISILVCCIMVALFFRILHRQEDLLHELATTDPLTGVLNRRSFNERLALAVDMHKRYGQPYAMIVLDVDLFKSVNDTYGHSVGDRVLRALVAAIRKRIRNNDELFRYGGEEFALILPQTGEVEARVLAQDLCRHVASSQLLHDREVTVSLGVSCLLADETAQCWLDRCDGALYQAKEEGRNRVCVKAVCG